MTLVILLGHNHQICCPLRNTRLYNISLNHFIDCFIDYIQMYVSKSAQWFRNQQMTTCINRHSYKVSTPYIKIMFREKVTILFDKFNHFLSLITSKTSV